MKDTLVPFGAGVAIGALGTGIIKLLLAAGIGYGIWRLMHESNEESDTCKSGPKQN